MSSSQVPTSPFEAIVAALPDFVYTFDLDGRFTYSNPSLSNLLLRKPGEMVGLNFHDLRYPEPLASTLQAQIQEVIDTKSTVKAETLFESASGIGYYEYIFVPLFSSDGQVTAVAGTTRDITERKQGEQELRASKEESQRLLTELRREREKLRDIFEKAPAFLASMSGPDFVLEFANEEYYKLVGRREIIGKSILEAIPEVEGQGFFELIQGVFTTGRSFVGREMSIMLARDGGDAEQRFIDFVYQALKDTSGAVTGILAHGVDVTEQVLARQEVERLNSELASHVQERTKELEIAYREAADFNYSISHDLRTPLRAIVATSRIALEEHAKNLNDEGKRLLERQAVAASKMAVQIDELLKLSRLTRQSFREEEVDLTALANIVFEEHHARNQGEACEFHVQPDMRVVADPLSMKILLSNLIDNALKFSPVSANVSVGMYAGPAGEPICWIRDHGIGVDMRYAERLFLPFERLVAEGEYPGTGMGLAIVKRIVERHRGRVWLESTPNQGTTVYFTLEKHQVE